MTDIIPAEQARVPATLAEAEIVLSRHGFSCGPFMATRLACSVIALHAELAHEREAHGHTQEAMRGFMDDLARVTKERDAACKVADGYKADFHEALDGVPTTETTAQGDKA